MLPFHSIVVSILIIIANRAALAGPYSGPTDTANPIDPAIPSGSPLFTEWASAIDPARTQFAPGGAAPPSRPPVSTRWGTWTRRRSPLANNLGT